MRKEITNEFALRYLVGKKSTHFINIITGISVLGVTIGTAALFLVLSVFNGFESLLSGMFNAFNPDVKISLNEGKFFELDSNDINQIKALPDVIALSATIEEVALFEYRDDQELSTLKGVDRRYTAVTGIDSLMLSGKFVLQNDNISYAVLGNGIKNKLAVNVNDRLNAIKVYMPSVKSSLMGSKDFNSQVLYPAGSFSVRSDNDYKYVLSSLPFAQSLLNKPNQAGALELKISPKANYKKLRSALQSILGPEFKIQDKYQQDEVTIKVMQIEKWISFLVASFIMILIAFNLLGALWMIVLDKRKDITVLKAMGMQDRTIKQIVVRLGTIITLIGIFVGFGVALILYYLQKNYGLIGVPDGFLIDAYPIEINWWDFLIVTVTVLFIGWVASVLPANKATEVVNTLK